MNLATTPTPRDWLDGLDDTNFGVEPDRTPVEEIQKNAHIVNGGTQEFKCPACRGTGNFITYTGRIGGRCFKCKGAGQITKGQNAAIKAKATKEANQLKWRDENKAAITYMHKRAEKGNHFYAGLIEKMNVFGTLTENQLRMVQVDMDKDDAFWAKKKAEQDAAAPKIGVDKIDALFETAKANGLIRPIFRTERLTIKRAPATGRNPGALYVTDRDLGGEYVGMIKDGQFKAKYGAKPDTLKLLCEIAGDPLEAAVKYGRSTGTCCICARELTDPVSVANGIGPICQGKFGL
jgi:hypothetical protein